MFLMVRLAGSSGHPYIKVEVDKVYPTLTLRGFKASCPTLTKPESRCYRIVHTRTEIQQCQDSPTTAYIEKSHSTPKCGGGLLVSNERCPALCEAAVAMAIPVAYLAASFSLPNKRKDHLHPVFLTSKCLFSLR